MPDNPAPATAPEPAKGSNDQGANGPAVATYTFTEDKLKAIAAKEKGEGRKAAVAELTESLGMTVEEAKKVIADAKARQDAEKTEAQKAREAADAEKAQAAKERSEAAAERHAVKLERALSVAGLAPRSGEDYVAYEARAAKLTRLVEVEVGADDAAIAAAAEAAKKEFPELFGTPATTTIRPVSGDPQGAAPRPQPNASAWDAGAELAKKYNEQRGVKVS